MDQKDVEKQMTEGADIEFATFALGRFVQYRLDEGMSEKMLEPFMQAYLNLTADLDGRERLSLRELRSHTASAEQAAAPAADRGWPSWLSAHEILRCRLRAQKNVPSKPDLDAQA